MSTHYSGTTGAAYARRQERPLKVKAKLILRKVQPFVQPTDSVVDFGCGTGRVLSLLDAGEKVGIEVNPISRERAESFGLRTVELSDELPDAMADVVYSHHALEHTLDPLRELRGLRRILRPGGRLVLIVPADDWRVQRQVDPGDINHHLYTWTPLLLGHLLSEAGFSRPRCRVVSHGWPGRLTWTLGDLLPRAAFDLVAFLTAVALRRRELHAEAWR